jgi:hypothetical protein
LLGTAHFEARPQVEDEAVFIDSHTGVEEEVEARHPFRCLLRVHWGPSSGPASRLIKPTSVSLPFAGRHDLAADRVGNGDPIVAANSNESLVSIMYVMGVEGEQAAVAGPGAS